MLEVRFLEFDRSAGRELGVNLSAANANGTNIGNSGQGGVTAAGRSPIGGINTNTGPFGAGGAQVGAPPTGSLPVLGTLGTLIGSARRAAVPPFRSLLSRIIRNRSGAPVRFVATAFENKEPPLTL